MPPPYARRRAAGAHGAVLWLPISFGIATAMHVVLVAKALVWPAWTQLLHPLATIIAKTKLLVLPVYPAAWPQARKHPFVEAVIRFGRYLGQLYLMRKLGYRFRQMESLAGRCGAALRRAAAATGVTAAWQSLAAGLRAVAIWIGGGLRAGMERLTAARSGSRFSVRSLRDMRRTTIGRARPDRKAEREDHPVFSALVDQVFGGVLRGEGARRSCAACARQRSAPARRRRLGWSDRRIRTGCSAYMQRVVTRSVIGSSRNSSSSVRPCASSHRCCAA